MTTEQQNEGQADMSREGMAQGDGANEVPAGQGMSGTTVDNDEGVGGGAGEGPDGGGAGQLARTPDMGQGDEMPDEGQSANMPGADGGSRAAEDMANGMEPPD